MREKIRNRLALANRFQVLCFAVVQEALETLLSVKILILAFAVAVLVFAIHETVADILRKERTNNGVGLGNLREHFLLLALDKEFIEVKGKPSTNHDGEDNCRVNDGIGGSVVVLEGFRRVDIDAVEAVTVFLVANFVTGIKQLGRSSVVVELGIMKVSLSNEGSFTTINNK